MRNITDFWKLNFFLSQTHYNGWLTIYYNLLNTACTEKEFQCDNERCLIPQQVCDGTEHCRDGSDEQSCGIALINQ